jgi:hypothetical protein
MFVFPNPYGHLDHNGRLADVCSKGERPYAAGKMPKREWIGATLDREHAERTYDPGDEGQGISPTSELRFIFDVAPVFIEEHPALRAYYKHAFDTRDLFKVAKADEVPIDQLALARDAAIERWRAEHGEAPDDAEWASQFAIDEQVKARSVAIAKEAAAKAEAEAKAARAAADKAAKSAPAALPMTPSATPVVTPKES